jgi:ATP-binding cassette subfamily B multidrug efflux pump
VVPQQAILFSGTIRENIAFGKPDASDEAILKAAGTAQILDFIQKSEKGLDTVLNQRGVNLSGGQKQRISIARALLPDPPILILDESTSALDARTAFYLQEALRKTRQHGATMIVGQRIASVKGADTIIVMDDGRIIDNAPHDVLVRRCKLYREIVKSQDEVIRHG